MCVCVCTYVNVCVCVHCASVCILRVCVYVVYTHIQTLCVHTDTNTNTWAFAMNSFSVLEYTWKRPEFSPKVVWDSQLGSCGKNQANYISMTTNVSVSTRTQGVTLAQTPMFLDANGVQRTFRLQLYNADVRIESTNGDGRFWSVFGTNITPPVSWPSTITNGLDDKAV